MAISRNVVDLTKPGYINDGMSRYCNAHHAVHDRGAEALERCGGSQINGVKVAQLAMEHGASVAEEPWKSAYIACIEANRAMDIASNKIGALLGPVPPAVGPAVFLTY